MNLSIDITPESDGTRHFCMHCQKESIDEYRDKDNNRVYACTSCHKESSRVIAFGKNAMMSKSPDGTLWHVSVAVFVFNDEGKVLCFERAYFPAGLITVPAGHAEIDKTIEESALMELAEEANIKDVELELVASEEIRGDSCSWGSDDHVWHVYKTHISDESVVQINAEGLTPMWLTPREIPERNATVGVRYFCRLFL